MDESDLIVRLTTHRHRDKGIHFPESRVDLTYAELADLTARMTRYLRMQEVGPGDAVGILASSTPEYVVAALGVIAVGGTVIPLPDPDLFRHAQHRIDPLARLIDAGGVRTVLVAAEHADLARLLQAHRPYLRLPICAIPDGPTEKAEFDQPSAQAPAIIQFNSGPAFSPRGVVLSHRAVAVGAATVLEAVAAGGDDRIAIWMPLSFDMGLITLLGGLLVGADVHIYRTSTLVRRPETILDHMQHVRITVCGGPNFCYERLCAAASDSPALGSAALSSLRAAVVAGEVVNPRTIAAFTRMFVPFGLPRTAITPAYGLAENTLMATCTPPGSGPVLGTFAQASLSTEDTGAVECDQNDPSATTLVSAGRPAPGVSLRIVAEDKVVDDGEVGEIQIRSASLMDRYAGRPDASASSFDGSWLRTRDRGFVHNGNLFICGRQKEMAIVNGRNIYASDIEAIVRELSLPIRSATATLTGHGEEIMLRVDADEADIPRFEHEIQRRCSLVLGFREIRVLSTDRPADSPQAPTLPWSEDNRMSQTCDSQHQ